MKSLTTHELTSLLASHTAVEIVDVRKAHDYDADPVMIPGASRGLPDRVADWVQDLAADAQVVAYCVHGHAVSAGVVDDLLRRGMKARLLDGGIEAWKAAGNTTVS